MIKVQPSASRIVKTETPVRLTLDSPKGDNVGGTMTVLGIGWMLAAVILGFQPFLESLGHVHVVIAVLLVPGFVLVVSGQVLFLRSWTLERTAASVTHTRRGLGGASARKWPAEDVTSFWVEEVKAPREAPRYVLRIGFRNGRSEDVLSSTSGEEVEWIAAIMKDPRGERRQTPSTARAAAEPVARRVDSSVVPPSIVSRRSGSAS